MQLVRTAILEADERVGECIKRKTPTFTFNGNIASINPQAKQFVSLMFDRGAEIPGDYPSMSCSGKVASYMQFKDAAAVEALKPELQAAVRAWCGMKHKQLEPRIVTAFSTWRRHAGCRRPDGGES